MGLTWAAGWAVGGVLIGVASLLVPGRWSEVFFKIFDAPLPALAVPGFAAGALFSLVLGTAARHRRFDQLSLGRFTVWGALGGVLVSLVPAAMVGLGLATLRPDLGIATATAVIAAPLALFSAVSAAGTLLLARRAERSDARLPAAS